jgi:hypothetical protein
VLELGDGVQFNVKYVQHFKQQTRRKWMNKFEQIAAHIEYEFANNLSEWGLGMHESLPAIVAKHLPTKIEVMLYEKFGFKKCRISIGENLMLEEKEFYTLLHWEDALKEENERRVEIQKSADKEFKADKILELLNKKGN